MPSFIANLATLIVEEVGGLSDGSLKIEYATDFVVCNGVDYYRHVPPVVAYYAVSDYVCLPESLNNRVVYASGKTLREHIRHSKSVAKSIPHSDKSAAFETIINRH